MPTEPYTITTPTSTVALAGDPGGARRGAVSFTVTNATGAPVRTEVRVLPGPGADPSWFHLAQAGTAPPPGGARAQSLEADFGAGETRQLVVDVAVAPTAPAGTYSLQPFACAAGRGDEVFTYGAAVDLAVAGAPAPRRRGVPWWALVAGAAVLVLLVGATAWRLVGGGDEDPGGPVVALPDLTGQPRPQAEAAIRAAGLVVGDVDRRSEVVRAKGTVLEQEPAAGQVAPGSRVDLVVADDPPVARRGDLTVAKTVLVDLDGRGRGPVVTAPVLGGAKRPLPGADVELGPAPPAFPLTGRVRVAPLGGAAVGETKDGSAAGCTAAATTTGPIEVPVPTGGTTRLVCVRTSGGSLSLLSFTSATAGTFTTWAKP